MSLLLLYDALQAAAEWTFARSSGPGGQNVNKVNSKALLTVPLAKLTLLSEHQRAQVAQKLAPRLVDGALTVHVQDTRSQLENRELALRRLEALVRQALVPVKARRATKPTRGSQERRLTAKKVTSRNKQGRSRSFED
jgi:ribosome-associated protein